MTATDLDLPYFFYFNDKLCQNIKILAYKYFSSINTFDFTELYYYFNIAGTTHQLEHTLFLDFLKNIYTYSNSTFDLTGNTYNPTDFNDTCEGGLTSDNIEIGVDDGFRIVLKKKFPLIQPICITKPITNNDSIYSIIYFNTEYIKTKLNSVWGSNIPFYIWSYLDPKTMIKSCKNTLSLFYPRLLNFNYMRDSSTNPYGSFKTNLLNFDANGNTNVSVVCSLRLINSTYKGPCIQINGTDIKFDINTGMISYDDIVAVLGTTPFPPLDQTLIITKIYNQMDVTQYFNTAQGSSGPYLQFYNLSSKISIPYINWTTTSSMELSNFTYDVNSPVFTVFTSIGFKDDITSTTTSTTASTTASTASKKTSITNVNINSNNVNYEVELKQDITNTPYTYIHNSSNIGSQGGGVYDIISPNLVNFPIVSTATSTTSTTSTTQSSKLFKTYTSILSWIDTETFPSNCFVSDSTQDSTISTYTQTVKNMTSTSSVSQNKNFKNKYSDIANASVTWFTDETNNVTKKVPSSELIIFVTDGVNVQMSDINKISQDNYSIWNNINILPNGTDLRCNFSVPEACELDNYNEICACYPSYIDVNVNDFINNLSLENKDKWCISSLCSSNLAYKNPLSKNKSRCSNICSSTINLTPDKYSNTNIDNAQIFSNCTNKNYLINSTTQPCLNCKDDEFCSLDNNGKRTCVKKSNCSLSCKDNYTCVIGNNNVDKCFPTSSTTNKCDSNLDCSKYDNTYCDTNYNICLQNPQKPNILIPILIFFGTLIVCICIFILYSKIIKKPILSKHNIKFYVIIIIISSLALILYFTIFKKSENFNINDFTKSKTTKCSNDNDCNSNPNSQCINNICYCKIGYNYPLCNISNYNICNSLSFLPHCISTGNYYYITILNNIIYAFAVNATFKFVNNKWYEVAKMTSNDQQINKRGYSPYNIIVTNSTTEVKYIALNSKMCGTSNNIVYFYIPRNTFLNFNTKDSSSEASYFVTFTPDSNDLDVEENKENDVQLNNHVNDSSQWKVLTYTEQFHNLSPIDNSNNINNIITIINSNYMYVFGGFDSQNKPNQNIIRFDLNTTDSDIIYNKNLYTYLNFSSAFNSVTFPNIIYLVGLASSGSLPNIYTFDLNKIKATGSDPKKQIYNIIFDLLPTIKCPPLLTYNNTNHIYNGNIILNYEYDKKFNMEFIYFFYNKGAFSSVPTLDICDKINLTPPKPPPTPPPTPPPKPHPKPPPTPMLNKNKYTHSSILVNILSYIFNKTPVTNINDTSVNISTLSGVNSYFKLNNFIFFLTSEGNLYKLSDYTTSSMFFNPCLGSPSVGPAIYNQINHIAPPGFVWSTTLNGYAQLPPSVKKNGGYIKVNCYEGFTGCTWCSGTYCKYTNRKNACIAATGTPVAGSYEYNITEDNGQCSINYESKASGTCASDTPCTGYCTQKFTSTTMNALNDLKQKENYYVCINSGQDMNGTTTSPKNPGWVKNTVGTGKFYQATINADDDNFGECSTGNTKTSVTPYCKY
jgi:hypothetical protein